MDWLDERGKTDRREEEPKERGADAEIEREEEPKEKKTVEPEIEREEPKEKGAAGLEIEAGKKIKGPGLSALGASTVLLALGKPYGKLLKQIYLLYLFI